MTADEVRKMLDEKAVVPVWPEAGQAFDARPSLPGCRIGRYSDNSDWAFNAGVYGMATPATRSVGRGDRRARKCPRHAAAARGEIPVIRIGKLLRVPVRALEQMLNNATPKAVA